jgi:hypothetical protein
MTKQDKDKFRQLIKSGVCPLKAINQVLNK